MKKPKKNDLAAKAARLRKEQERLASKLSDKIADRLLDQNIHLSQRVIYIGTGSTDSDGSESGVDADLASLVIKGVLLLELVSKTLPIRFILNNIGGDSYHMLAIYDAIRGTECPTEMHVLGCAMSAGAVILQAADKRILYPSSRLMIHDGTESVRGVPSKSLSAWAKEAEKVNDLMYGIFASRSHHRDPLYWEKRCTHDYILTAHQAVDEGLADEVAEPPKKKLKA